VNKNRQTRVNDEFAREIANIIRSDLKDPRAGAIISVMRAQVSPDLRHCKVFVSILGNAEEQKASLEMLEDAAGFIRKQIAERLNPRVTPEIKFVFDDSMEYGFKMDKLIDEIVKKDNQES
jgi:ribosome-binding factor A